MERRPSEATMPIVGQRTSSHTHRAAKHPFRLKKDKTLILIVVTITFNPYNGRSLQLRHLLLQKFNRSISRLPTKPNWMKRRRRSRRDSTDDRPVTTKNRKSKSRSRSKSRSLIHPFRLSTSSANRRRINPSRYCSRNTSQSSRRRKSTFQPSKFQSRRRKLPSGKTDSFFRPPKRLKYRFKSHPTPASLPSSSNPKRNTSRSLSVRSNQK